jgi:transglutaminase-like putative cysteine protease
VNKLAIREGWSTVLLVSVLVYISVWSLLRADWAAGMGFLNWVTLAGLITGVAVAKWRTTPSVIAHVAGAAVGMIIVVYYTSAYLDDRIGGTWAKLTWLWGRWERWVAQLWAGEPIEDLYLFVFFSSLLVFLLAYGTMWFVLRARWIWAALVFPGVVLFINLGYSLRVPNSYVVFYLFFALVLLVRFSMLERETTWRKMRVDYPDTLVVRGMWAATYLAVFVLIFGWAFPASAQSRQAHEIWLTVDGPWRAVESRFDYLFSGLRGTSGRGVGGFAAFDDNFELGGPLRLSDTPVVLVTGESYSPYLVAHRYSEYTGAGWRSEFARPKEDEEPRILPPQIELRADESVPVDPAQLGVRRESTFTLVLENPRGSLIFYPEVFSRSNIGVNLVLPWRVVTDVPVNLENGVPANVPAEVQRIGQMLADLDLTPPPPPPPPATPTPEGGVAETDDEEGSDVEETPVPELGPLPPLPEPGEVTRELQDLASRGFLVSYFVNAETYQVDEMTYSGEFPAFDDVEAVHARDGLAAGQSYDVTALETQALTADLRQSSTNYPAIVVERYTQLPDTVTRRTVELAYGITAGLETPYDKSKALERWLRESIAYTEDIAFPPPDRDVVDFVLFDTRQGYCEYYASAFIVMARSLGIPARMVTGFFPAERDAELGGFLYRDRNAHAWPEVYFEGFGWVPFEPTASRSEFEREPAGSGSGGVRPEGIIGTGQGFEFFPLEDELAALERDIVPGSGRPGSAGLSQDTLTRQEIAIRAGSLALMALVLVVLYLWLRGIRGLSPAAQMYTRLSRGASWSGIRQPPSMTPAEYADKLGRSVPGSRTPARFLADIYVRETYGNRPPVQADMLRARHSWIQLRGLLFKHFFQRLRPWKGSVAEEDDNGNW